MKKNLKKFSIIVVIGLMMMQIQINSYAGQWSNAKEILDVSEFNSEGQTRVLGIPRGRLISSVEIQLKDKGRGTAGVYADLLCHEPMEYLRIWLYLEKWDEKMDDWTIVDSQEFTWLAEDYPEQDLTMAVVGYDVSGLERGVDYRLRGMFGAKDLDSVLQETWQVISADLPLE